MRALRFIKSLARHAPLLLALTTLLWVVVSVVNAFSLVAVAPIIDYLTNPDLKGASAVTVRFAAALESAGLPAGLPSMMAVFILLSFAGNSLQIAARHLILRIKYAMTRDLMVGAFDDFFRAKWNFFATGRQGTLFNTFMRELGVVGDAFEGIGIFVSSILQLALYLAVPLWVSWRITLISLGSALAFSLPFLLLGRFSYRLGRRSTSTANRLGEILSESLGAPKIILGFGERESRGRALGEAYDEHVGATIIAQTLNLSMPLVYFPMSLIVVCVVLYASHRLSVPLSESAILLYAFLRIVPAMGQLMQQKNKLENFLPSFEQLENLRGRAQGMRQRSGSRKFHGFEKELTLDGLSFSYPERGRAISELSLKIPKGSMTAFVGESGAGKSTLIDLVMGFHEPEKGGVAFDGVPLEDFDIDSYRRKLGYVPQESVLFNMSIRENLLWAKPDASEDDLRAACRDANAEEFISQLPDGLDTVVGDRGVRLSGGQIQRVALARAILRRPELLILDEATSSLDSQSERLIQKAVEDIAKKTTTIVIAHRLSTIVNADKVCVLSKGKLVEQGTYQELIGRDGQFNRLAKYQILTSEKEKQGNEA